MGTIEFAGVIGQARISWEREVLLWWGVLDELDALLDVALKALDTSLEELLLLFGYAAKHVNGFLCAIGL